MLKACKIDQWTVAKKYKVNVLLKYLLDFTSQYFSMEETPLGIQWVWSVQTPTYYKNLSDLENDISESENNAAQKATVKNKESLMM